ncbi:NAD(P)H-dependent oxidoreductase [Mucilaginibacter robiniae]|uniref:NAD(P)H-dependent oxidoreductase n=1 Tax=Mucilaginibacter robiniae TaxID=2728022 RepID=A0A7L5E1U3_9SPHI|nr:NAD(P)H-dependent oxidoreductase [Mucilaginibacter robiniae]QJD96367.1 NAD(P)H-dependent oxidoreductase [Mucilaginibacter robiniae]
MSLIKPLQWRYATKKFDATKKLSAEQLEDLLSAIQLAPSSYGLQHYRILVVEDPAVRQQLREAAYGQTQLTDASQILVFAAETVLDANYIKRYINEVARVRQVDASQLAPFEKSLMDTIDSRAEDQKIAWSHKQAYIALGVALTAAAEAGIDACPMEGFNAGKFDEILGLRDKNLTTSVIACIGFRAEDDKYSEFAKVRKPKDDLFIRI